MTHAQILITDYAWPDLLIEQEALARIGAEIVLAEQTDEATLVRQAAGVDAIMTCWANVSAPVIESSGKLQIVARLGIGLDNIDVVCCTRRQVIVTNVPDYCLTEVAEHTLALLFSLARKIAHFHHEARSQRYDLQSGLPMWRIEGQTLGIVGLGNIGLKVAEKAQALGLRVIATSRRQLDAIRGVPICSLEELLERSDYVSLHLPLTEDTWHCIGAPELRRMKRTAFLINTARGDLIDHQALAVALREDRLAGAGLDVQSPEPPDLNEPPYNDPRVIVTPHAAFVSTESLVDLRCRAAEQVVTRLTGGVPENIVNPAVLSG